MRKGCGIMHQEYGPREVQNEFLRRFIYPILVGEFSMLMKNLKETPEERHFRISYEAGLNRALQDLEEYGPSGHIDKILRHVRRNIALARFGPRKYREAIDGTVLGYGNLLDKMEENGEIPDEALTLLCERHFDEQMAEFLSRPLMKGSASVKES